MNNPVPIEKRYVVRTINEIGTFCYIRSLQWKDNAERLAITSMDSEATAFTFKKAKDASRRFNGKYPNTFVLIDVTDGLDQTIQKAKRI